DPVLGVEGDYKGFFHHERLDLYQYGAVNILTYPDPAGGGALRMSAAARLSFGGKDSPEVLTYRFQPKDYDILGQTFTFENPADKGCGILRFESLRQGTMTGIWYSRHHGRIGTFKLMRDGDLDLPDGTAVMKSLGGHYESETFTMEVGVHRGPNGAGSANPY